MPRGYRLPRCGGCGLSPAGCLCQNYDKRTPPCRISLIITAAEARKPTNTGRLLELWLSNTTQFVRGERDGVPTKRPRKPLAIAPLSADQLAAWSKAPESTAVLFPSAEAEPLSAAPVEHLIVPDGTWSETRRLVRRKLAPLGFRMVQLTDVPPTRYALRRRGGQSLCTLEAVAHALRQWRHGELAQELEARFSDWHQRALMLRQGGSHPPSPQTPGPSPRRDRSIAQAIGAESSSSEP